MSAVNGSCRLISSYLLQYRCYFILTRLSRLCLPFLRLGFPLISRHCFLGTFSFSLSIRFGKHFPHHEISAQESSAIFLEHCCPHGGPFAVESAHSASQRGQGSDKCVIIGQTLEMARPQLGKSDTFTSRLDLLSIPLHRHIFKELLCQMVTRRGILDLASDDCLCCSEGDGLVASSGRRAAALACWSASSLPGISLCPGT